MSQLLLPPIVDIKSILWLTLFCFFVGKDRQLCSVDLKQVTSRARQSNSTSPLTELTSQTIEKITNCHLFAIGQVRYDYSHEGIAIIRGIYYL